MLLCYHALFRLESKFELEETENYEKEASKQDFKSKLSQYNELSQRVYTNDFNRSTSFTSSATCVNRFKFSTIYNSNDKSKTSNSLKKSAQFVKASMRNEFHSSYRRTTREHRLWSLYFHCRISEIEIARTFLRSEQTTTSTRTFKIHCIVDVSAHAVSSWLWKTNNNWTIDHLRASLHRILMISIIKR